MPVSAEIDMLNKNLALPVMEQFYTIQGEGYHQGRAAYFIRLGGCDVGCVWCDVKESWDASVHPIFTIEEIVEKTISGIPKSTSHKMAVITGGEPLLHNLDALTASLQNKGVETNIETSGTSPLSGAWDWICLSPKKFKPTLPDIYEKAHELKMVIYHPSDLQWAEKEAEKVSTHCKLFLQPEWSKSDSITPLIVDYIKNHPQWQLSLQIHKYINVP